MKYVTPFVENGLRKLPQRILDEKMFFTILEAFFKSSKGNIRSSQGFRIKNRSQFYRSV